MAIQIDTEGAGSLTEPLLEGFLGTLSPEEEDKAYDNYLTNRPQGIHNVRFREEGQTFSDAMCEGSIVSGVANGEKILDMIRKASN
jgi:hypothetical protein